MSLQNPRAKLMAVALVLAAGFHPVRAGAADGPPRRAPELLGVLLSANGDPVRSARIELTAPDGEIAAETTAGDSGEFTIPNLPVGRYYLFVREGGRAWPPRAVDHTASREERITIRLDANAVPRNGPAATNSEIAELRKQLAAMRVQQELLERRLAGLAARGPQDGAAAEGPGQSGQSGDAPLVAALQAPPLPSTLFPSPVGAGVPAPPPPQSGPAQDKPAPGRGATDRGLYQGLAAGAPGQRYGRSLFSEYVRLGGYGSFRYEANNIDLSPKIGDLPQLKRGHNGFDFRRFVMTMDASPFDKLRFYMELEFERLNSIEIERNAIPENRGRASRNRRGTRFIQAVEGQSGGEIAMEQAWMEYKLAPRLAARMGVILPPVGRYNILHDDDYWDLPRRPLAVRGGPATPVKNAWRELGAGLVFNKPVGDGFVDAQFYVVNGVKLDFTVEQVAALREGRNLVEVAPEIAFSSGAFDGSQSADAVTWKLNLSPKLGHEFGISGYHGNYSPDYLRARGRINTLAFDGKATLGNFEAEGEFIYTKFGNLGNVLNDMAVQMVDVGAATSSSETAGVELETEGEFKGPFTDNRKGFWVDLKYRSRPGWLKNSFLGREFEDPQLIPIIRWERVWYDDFVNSFEFAGSRIEELETEDLAQERISLGLAYRPAPSVVFSTAWEYNRRLKGSQLISPRPVGTDPLFDKSFDSLVLGATFGF